MQQHGENICSGGGQLEASSRALFLRSRTKSYNSEHRCTKEIEALANSVSDTRRKYNAATARFQALQEAGKSLELRLQAMHASLQPTSATPAQAHDSSAQNPSSEAQLSTTSSVQVSQGSEVGQRAELAREQVPQHSRDSVLWDSCQKKLEFTHTDDHSQQQSKRREAKPAADSADDNTLQHRQVVGKYQHRPSPIWQPEKTDPMRERPLTNCRALISYKEIAVLAPSAARHAAQEGTSDHEWFNKARVTYLHDTATQLHRRVSDVLWVVQFGYGLTGGETLSTCGVAFSFMSALSVVLAHTATSFECVMLEAEHDFLEGFSAQKSNSASVRVSGSADSSRLANAATGARSVLHKLLAESSPSTPVDTRALNDAVAACAARLRVHCGLRGSCPLVQAVRSVVKQMLHQQEKCVLPPHLWKAACMIVVHSLQTSVNRTRAQMPDAATQLARQMEGGAPPLSAVPLGQSLLTELMLWEVCTAVQQGLEQGAKSADADLITVRARMLELGSLMTMVGHVQFLRNPRTSLVMLTRSHTIPAGQVKVERMRMRTITDMALSAEQNQQLATQWRRWVRRRAVLSEQQCAALAYLDDILPLPEDVQTAHLAASAHLPTLSAASAQLHRSCVDSKGTVELYPISSSGVMSISVSEESTTSGSDDPPLSDGDKEPLLPVALGMYDEPSPPTAKEVRRRHRQEQSKGGLAVPSQQGSQQEAHSVLVRRNVQWRFLGESGADIHALEEAVGELLQLSYSDLLLISTGHDLFNLTPVQLVNCYSAHVKHGALKFDIFRLQQVAAHEERWKELFAPLRIFE